MSLRRTFPQSGFALAEIMVVVTLIGSFATGLLASVNPSEYIKKNADANRVKTANTVYGALIRSGNTTGKYPWSTALQSVPLSSAQGRAVIESLVTSGGIKDASAIGTKDAGSLFLTASADGKNIRLCFILESLAYKSRASYCSTTACYTCIGDTSIMPSGGFNFAAAPVSTPTAALNQNQLHSAACKNLNAECRINDSAQPCCPGLLCRPDNQNSGNGKCGPPVTPTPIQTPTTKPTATPSPTVAYRCEKETLVIPFSAGAQGVNTVKEFENCPEIRISGTGRASGSALSDAFYVFTDTHGAPVEKPIHYTLPYNWTLWINSRSAEYSLQDQQVPPYNSGHEYTFRICLPRRMKINFGVGDTYTVDNAESYTAEISCPH